MISVEELPIPQIYKERLKKLGITHLYPPQELAVKAGLFQGKNLVLATPTASGKTLVAILAMIKHISENRGKIIYLVPLKALANEKYEEFCRFFEGAAKIIIATGDYDDKGEKLGQADIVVATYEKMDSLLRHKPYWLDKISLVVIDEIHYISSIDRGPTLEILITKLLYELGHRETQFIALSATIVNTEDFERWLNTRVVSLNWRPVPLKEGVYTGSYIIYSDGSIQETSVDYGNKLMDLVMNSLRDGGQTIVFVQRRRDAVLLARKIANAITGERGRLFYSIKPENEKISREILATGEVTELTKVLAELVRFEVGFHHAGLCLEHRRIVERAFRDGYIRVLTATPTLAAGVNLPARRVIISTLYRYELGFREPISVFEYKQMAGRAGRPQYDKFGEAIVLARSEDEAEYIMNYYVKGKLERLTSKLVDTETLDMHILGLLAYRDGLDIASIVTFFSKTLCAAQFGIEMLERKIKQGIKGLVRGEFISKRDGKYYITKFGRRTAELYILPSTAIILKEFISKLTTLNTLSLLFSIVSTPDSALAPYYYRDDEILERMLDYAIRHGEISEDELTALSTVDSYYTSSETAQRWKTVFVLNDWINEAREDEILKKWRVEPGDLQAITNNAEWLSYAASQISLLLNKPPAYTKYFKLSQRLKHGVKEELIPLVMMSGIGRIRARNLYLYGYKTPADIKRASYQELVRVPGIGDKLAKKLLGMR